MTTQHNQNSKTIQEIRRDNMEALFVRFKDYVWARFPKEPERGMMKRFAQAANNDPRYMSHVRNGRKEIGHAMARKMEEGIHTLGPEFKDVVPGWMDNDHSRTVIATYEEEAIINTAQMCFQESPIETQRALNELARQILLRRVTKP